MSCGIQLLCVGLVLLGWIQTGEGLTCYSCNGGNSNNRCKENTVECGDDQFCFGGVHIKGTGQVQSIRKGCQEKCGFKRRRSCGSPGCSYCCNYDHCNDGISNPTRRTPDDTSLENDVAFIARSGNVTESGDGGHLVRLSRVVTNVGNALNTVDMLAVVNIAVEGNDVAQASAASPQETRNQRRSHSRINARERLQERARRRERNREQANAQREENRSAREAARTARQEARTARQEAIAERQVARVTRRGARTTGRSRSRSVRQNRRNERRQRQEDRAEQVSEEVLEDEPEERESTEVTDTQSRDSVSGNSEQSLGIQGISDMGDVNTVARTGNQGNNANTLDLSDSSTNFVANVDGTTGNQGNRASTLVLISSTNSDGTISNQGSRANGPTLRGNTDSDSGTTLPSVEAMVQGTFTLMASRVVNHRETSVINVSQVLVNNGQLIQDDLKTAELTIKTNGIYVFHVTSIAARSDMIATPLLLLKNEIVLETGQFNGVSSPSTHVALSYVTVPLVVGDIIRLVTAPEGGGGGSLSSPSEVTFTGFLLSAS